MDPLLAKLESFLSLGLPEPPAAMPQVEEGDIAEVPVAFWRNGNRAAVLWVEQDDADEDVCSRIDVFLRLEAGWMLEFSGGGSWFGDLNVSIPTDQVYWMGLGVSIARANDEHLCITGGLAGARVKAVGIRNSRKSGFVTIDSRTGAFLVGFDCSSPCEVGPLFDLSGPTNDLIRSMKTTHLLTC